MNSAMFCKFYFSGKWSPTCFTYKWSSFLVNIIDMSQQTTSLCKWLVAFNAFIPKLHIWSSHILNHISSQPHWKDVYIPDNEYFFGQFTVDIKLYKAVTRCKRLYSLTKNKPVTHHLAPMCRDSCSFAWTFCLKDFPQTEHINAFSPD